MYPVQQDSILGILHGYNPWWSSGRVSSEFAPPVRRALFERLDAMVAVHEPRARVLLTGPRRVGKTTILYQLIVALLKRGVEPKRILYLDLDHPLLQLSEFPELIRLYLSNVLIEPQPCYFFFDEIQATADWNRGIDVIRRRKNLPARLVATGTFPPGFNRRGRGKPRLAGWSMLRLPTLRFREFISIVRPGIDLETPRFDPSTPPPTRPEDLLEDHHTNRTLIPLFNEFLLRGGFPEVARMNVSPTFIQKYLRDDVVERILFRDVAYLYGTQNLPELERLFIHIALKTGDRFNLSDLAISLGISRTTVSQYIRHLESTHLIYLVRNFQGKGRGSRGLRSRPRIYVVDGSLRNAVLMRSEEFLRQGEELETVARTVLMNHLAEYARERGWKLHHYRDRLGARTLEVDGILETEDGVVPIALKYRRDTGPEDIQDLYSFIGKHRCRHGYLLTRGTTKKRIRETFFEDIFEVPLWTFLHGLAL